jgi:hypothetical protein
MRTGTVISACDFYRYRLERQAAGAGSTAVIMVNPSTADAEKDDATIRKLRGFGDRHGWGRIVVGNLFAYRATDVRQLGLVDDPIGPLNDHYLNIIFQQVELVVFAWGPLGKQPPIHRERWRHVTRMATSLGHLPLRIGAPAKCGHPRHPLMLAYAELIEPWSMPA